MPGKPNNLPIIIAVVAALGGIVLLNVFQQGNDPVIQDKIQKESERKAQEDAQKKGGANTPPPPSEPQPPGANDVVTWGAESIQGKKGGTPKVTLGWQWTPAVQGNPGTIYSVVQNVEKVLPNAEIRVVNLDLKPGVVPPGVAVNGTSRIPILPDGTIVNQPQMYNSLKGPASQ